MKVGRYGSSYQDCERYTATVDVEVETKIETFHMATLSISNTVQNGHIQKLLKPIHP